MFSIRPSFLWPPLSSAKLIKTHEMAGEDRLLLKLQKETVFSLVYSSPLEEHPLNEKSLGRKQGSGICSKSCEQAHWTCTDPGVMKSVRMVPSL